MGHSEHIHLVSEKSLIHCEIRDSSVTSFFLNELIELFKVDL